jgi:hypothetical protein
MLMIMTFLGCKWFPIEGVVVVVSNVVFYHSSKIKWNFNINEKWCIIVKQGVFLNFYKIISVHLHKCTVMN